MKNDIKNIIENYKTFEKELIAQLNYGIKHPTTAGSFREEIWKSLFERIVPKKFKIERSVFIIDSKGNFSNEVDLAIFDEQYTPYVFNYGKIKFIPIEAVAAVVECKSSNYDKEQIKNWVESVNKLKTSDKSIVRTINFISNKPGKTQSSTAPIKIFCHIPSKLSEENEISSDFLMDIEFDIIIEAKKNNNKMNIFFKHKELTKWYEIINHAEGLPESEKPKELEGKDIEKNYEISDESGKISLLSFIFQFNQLLMLLNNPMFFPHQAYVKLFNDEISELSK